MIKKPASTAQRGTTDDVLACAGDLMEVMPLVMGAMRAAMRRQPGGGMTVPQFRCLNFIDRNPDCSISALAAHMGTTLATASTSTDRLVRAGLARTRAAPADRRRSELRTTAKGAEMLAGMRKCARQDMAAALGSLGDDDIALLRQAMAALRHGFGAGLGGPAANTAF